MTNGSRTLLRTIRIGKHLDNVIQKDSKEKRMSVNALISSILTRYAEWDRNTERFGFLTLTRETFSGILGTADDEKLVAAARELGAKVPKEIILFWFKKMNLENFLAYILMTCRYGGVAECKYESEGKNHTITVHHEYGKKWSLFMKHFFEEGLRAGLGLEATFELEENSVVGSFSER